MVTLGYAFGNEVRHLLLCQVRLIAALLHGIWLIAKIPAQLRTRTEIPWDTYGAEALYLTARQLRICFRLALTPLDLARAMLRFSQGFALAFRKTYEDAEGKRHPIKHDRCARAALLYGDATR